MYAYSLLASVVVATLLGCSAAVNPLGRFGTCQEPCVYDTSYDFSKDDGLWFLQYKPTHPDNYAHHCQMTNEKVEKYNSMYIYYRAMNVIVTEPIKFQFKRHGPGRFTGDIVIDCETVTIFLYVLYVSKDFRVTYMCTNDCNADANIRQVLTWTRVPNPCDSILEMAYKKMEEVYLHNFGIQCPKMDKVVQDEATCSHRVEICTCD